MTAYVTVREALAHAKARHLDMSGLDDVTFSALLLRASELLDGCCVFQGTKQASTQIRAWPRRNAYDENGYELTIVPPLIKAVSIELAVLLFQDETDALRALGMIGTIQTERVGDVHVSYDRQSRSMPVLLRRLWPLLAASQPVYVRRG